MTATTRLLVSRHGDADYPVHGVLTDVGGWLTDKGKAQVDALARSLVGDDRWQVVTWPGSADGSKV